MSRTPLRGSARLKRQQKDGSRRRFVPDLLEQRSQLTTAYRRLPTLRHVAADGAVLTCQPNNQIHDVGSCRAGFQQVSQWLEQVVGVVVLQIGQGIQTS